MHATPQRVQPHEPARISQLRPAPAHNSLNLFMLRFARLLRLAFWRSFEHDAFAVAKASAYSMILTFFPTLLVIGSLLANSRKTAAYLREISYALGRILPAGSASALDYLKANSAQRSAGLLITTSLITLWTASGVMISWMEGFRHAYELPKIWGLVKERLMAFFLVILAGAPMCFATVLVAFGNRIELRVLSYFGGVYGLYVLLMWAVIRWTIAALTSIAVIALIYHYAVPRTQPWHSVLPGATLATAMWFAATALFGGYLQAYADYSVIYGSLGVGIALLVWMYLISLVILIGAEFNAMLFPRTLLGRELRQMNGFKTLLR
jgi:membrane protein